MRHLVIILTAVLIINESGMAYDMPTQEQVLACAWDARRFCGPYLVPNLATAMGGDARAILHVCMQAHERQLSPRCREAFK
jgi:hypothetical protein